MLYASTKSQPGADPRVTGGTVQHQDGVVFRRQSPFWLPLSIVALAVFIVSADFRYAASGGGEVYGQLIGSTSLRQFVFLALGAMGSWLLLGCFAREKLPVWPLLFPALVLVCYVYTSTLWSDDPSTTLKRAVVLTCIVVAGFGMGKIWNFLQFSRAIVVLSSVFLVVSLCAEVHYHAWLSNPGEYRFSGVFHPAKQAFNCGMLVLASLTLFFAERRKLFLVITGIALAFLLLTKARTGLAATLIASGVLAWPHLSMKTIVRTGVLAAWMAAALLVYFGATGKDLAFARLATMGRDEVLADPTKLTGRLPIWNKALALYSEKPLLGYGYGAFWTQRRLGEFERENGWALGHSHSAYIESLVNLGAVGLILGICVASIAIVRIMRLSALAHSVSARLVAGLFTLAIVSGFTEVAFIKDGYEFLVLAIGVGLIAFETTVDRKTSHPHSARVAFPYSRLPEARP